MSKRSSKSSHGHKSSPKQSSSSAETSQAHYERPWPPRSYLFAINELLVNDDTGRGGTMPRYDHHGRWEPPVSSNGFDRPVIGQLYRWDEGIISVCYDCPLREGAYRVSVTSNAPLATYRTNTLFWCNPFTQFMIVPGDASTYNIASATPPNNRWWPLNFEHDGDLSRVAESGQHPYLAGRRLAWIRDLGLESYACHQGVHHGGLAGNLAAVVGLVAFSCSSSDLEDVLVRDQAWIETVWRGHNMYDGRIGGRGVVAHIYYDPANTSGSTYNILQELEWRQSAMIH